MKQHSETHIIKNTVMKQSKLRNGNLKLEHKKISNMYTELIFKLSVLDFELFIFNIGLFYIDLLSAHMRYYQ